MATEFKRISPFLWFDRQAEEAANFYVSIFDRSHIGATSRYGKESAQASGQPEGSVMTISFELDGQAFTAINGGPHFEFSGAISFVVHCRTQAEVDRYWERLGDGGDPAAQQCGWLKDRFGVSWQVVPTELPTLLCDPDPQRARRAMGAMLKMKKLDIDAMKRAADGP
jgi:predicted 3-demethylubiquinone-9 3-methyltransferase (glyoxalase superfamily)